MTSVEHDSAQHCDLLLQCIWTALSLCRRQGSIASVPCIRQCESSSSFDNHAHEQQGRAKCTEQVDDYSSCSAWNHTLFQCSINTDEHPSHVHLAVTHLWHVQSCCGEVPSEGKPSCILYTNRGFCEAARRHVACWSAVHRRASLQLCKLRAG